MISKTALAISFAIASGFVSAAIAAAPKHPVRHHLTTTTQCWISEDPGMNLNGSVGYWGDCNTPGAKPSK